MKKLWARGGPLGVFSEYPILVPLALTCVFAETSWATLLIVMEFLFKEELLRGQPEQFVASRVATAMLAFVGFETIFKYPMGTLADRYGPRKFVLGALAVCAVTPLLMFLLARQWWHFIPIRAVDGIAAAALWPAMSALMARAVPREAKAASMSVFNGAYCVGLAIGPMTGLALGHATGSNFNVFLMCSVLMGIGFALFFMTVNAGEKALEKQAASTRATHGAAGHHHESELKTSIFRGRPMLLRMMALYAVSQIAIGILAPTVPIFIESQFGIYQKNLGPSLIIPALFVAIIAIPLGRLPDTLGRVRSVWISYSMAAFGMLLVSISSRFAPIPHPTLSLSLSLFCAGMLLLVASYILNTPAWLGLTSLQVDDKRQAQALSLMQTAQGIGVVIAFFSVALAGSFLTQWKKVGAAIKNRVTHEAAGVAPNLAGQDTVPLSAWFWVSALLFALCLLGTLLWIQEPPHSPEREENAESDVQPLQMTGL